MNTVHFFFGRERFFWGDHYFFVLGGGGGSLHSGFNRKAKKYVNFGEQLLSEGPLLSKFYGIPVSWRVLFSLAVFVDCLQSILLRRCEIGDLEEKEECYQVSNHVWFFFG